MTMTAHHAPAPETQILLTGLALGESPRWHDSRLWFANWLAQEIIAVDPAGNREVILHVPFAAIPYSIDWLPTGQLLLSSSSERPLLRQEPDGSLVDHAGADLATLSPSFNELVVDGRGNAYLNGADFSALGEAGASAGVLVLVTPDGASRVVADGFAFPNGMAVTPDDGTLIVADSYGKHLLAFTIDPDGGLSGRRVWADLGDGTPDGICLDAEGCVWYADVPNRRCVRVREGGAVLQTIDLDRGAFACMLGGDDGRTLFILAAEWHG
ncbi:MAG TPA: SMP-30/gluconolactonase/LRE family protein, partial [Thermomicrobiales bacterium]